MARAASMSPALEIRLMVARELRRSVRSVKGIILGVLTLVGALATAFVCVKIEGASRADAGAASTQAYVELRRQAIEKVTGDASFAAYAASIPSSLLVFLKITVWLGPMLIALLGFDIMSSEFQYRSVRFWTVRTRRWTYFAGKLLGLWLLVGLVTFALNAIAGGFAAAFGYVTMAQLVGWGLRFWFVAFVIAGAWASIATLISSRFKTPILALLTTFGTFFVMWLFGLGGFISRVKAATDTGIVQDMSWYEYLYPNAYDTLLLAQQPQRVLLALGILLGFVAVCTAGGSFLFARRDI